VTHPANETASPPEARDDRPFRRWLATALAVPMTAIDLRQIAGDASPRRYFRATCPLNNTDDSGLDPEDTQATGDALAASPRSCNADSWIAVTSPPSENNAAFLAVQQMLDAAGLVVPTQYANGLDQGFFLMEDFGDVLLASQLTADAVDCHYEHALSELRKIARIPIESVALPHFDAARIQDELSVFPEWFVCAHLGLGEETLADDLWGKLLTFLTDVFLNQPQCVVHRDFHSRNIMCLADERLGLIDFQDAVMGPITYDPVSLLKDCYLQWPRSDQLRWLEAHRQALLTAGVAVPDEQDFIRDFDLVGLQRHLRVLGVFARLCLRDAKPAYLNDLPLVLAYTREAMRLYAGEPAVAAFAAWFEDVVMPRVGAQSWYQRAAVAPGAKGAR